MRILIAGTSSGCGKTTVALSLVAVLRAKGLTVAPFKVGPDYIDPGFHVVACGRPSDNLDGHLFDTATVRALLRAGEERADVAAIEGVMVNFLLIACRMTEKLQRFGYVNVTDRTGLTFPAHEFHHAEAEPLSEVPCAFRVVKAGVLDRPWSCGYERGNTLAGFPHLHFGSHPELIRRLGP